MVPTLQEPVDPVDEMRSRVRQCITRSGLTQRAFAEQMGLDPPKLSKSLSGTRRFTTDELIRLSHVTGVSVNWLISGQDTTPDSPAVPTASLESDRTGDTPEKRRKRQEIIAAAWRLFGRQGYSDTSMADIADTCHVSPSILNYYFSSKRALFEECLRYCVRLSFDRQAAQPHGEGHPAQRLKQLIDLQLPAGAVRTEWSIWLQSWYAVTVGIGSQTNHSRAYLRWYRAVRDVLQDGQQAGVFVDIPIDDLAVDLTSLFDGLAIKVLVGTLTVEAIRARLHSFVDHLAPAASLPKSSHAPIAGEKHR